LAARANFTGEISTAMSVEPGIVDTNVLVYALDAPQHAAARALLESRARLYAGDAFVTPQNFHIDLSST